MSKTIKELGRKHKIKFPGKFDHLTDEQVGRAVKKTAQANGFKDYDDYLESPTESLQIRDKNATFTQLLQDITGNSASLFTSATDLEVKVNQIINTFNPHQGWIGGWLAEKRTGKQSEVLAHLSNNQQQIISQYMAMARAVREGKEEEINFKLFVARNVTELMNVQALAQRIEKATELGIPEPNYTDLRVGALTHEQTFAHRQEIEQYEFTLQQKKDQHELDMFIKKETAMSRIRIDEAQATADMRSGEKLADSNIQWQKYKNEKDLDVQVSILANLVPIAEIGALTKALISTIQTIQQIKQLPNADQFEDQVEIFEHNKQNLRKIIDERFEGLLQDSK